MLDDCRKNFPSRGDDRCMTRGRWMVRRSNIDRRREISPCSARRSANRERCRCVGCMPPVSARIRCIEEWFRSNNRAICCSDAPLRQHSHINAFRLSVWQIRRLCFMATPLAAMQPRRCCIDGLSPQPKPAGRHRCPDRQQSRSRKRLWPWSFGAHYPGAHTNASISLAPDATSASMIDGAAPRI